jgi:DNA-binding transcriptional ArsR family regulator
MTLDLHFTDGSAQVDLDHSPLLELAFSLQVLAHPRQHTLHLPWVRRCRTLSPPLRDEIRVFAPIFHFTKLPAFFGVGIGTGLFGGFADELAALRALPEEQLLSGIVVASSHLRPAGAGVAFGDDAFRDRALASAALLGGTRAQLVGCAYTKRDILLGRLFGLLEGVWEEAFAQEWERIEPLLDEEAARCALLLAERGVGEVLRELGPDVRLSADGRSVSFSKASPFDDELRLGSDDPLTLVPSIYAWPHVRVEHDAGTAPWIVYPTAALRSAARPALAEGQLLGLLRAMGDDTRLRILRLLAPQPRSTRELASLLSLSEAAVSRHLSKLAGSGLVKSRREGYYVLYSLQADTLGSVGPAVQEWVSAG